jgi:hypothetical protein
MKLRGFKRTYIGRVRLIPPWDNIGASGGLSSFSFQIILVIYLEPRFERPGLYGDRSGAVGVVTSPGPSRACGGWERLDDWVLVSVQTLT